MKYSNNPEYYKRSETHKKMSPMIHSSPEYKDLRKMFQGINATTKGSIEKSKRRHNAKLKALNKIK